MEYEASLNIANILEKKGMSTAEFAEKTGVTYNTALGIRRGNISRINLETIAKICLILDVSPNDIFLINGKKYDS